jgi:hypothetical protein
VAKNPIENNNEMAAKIQIQIEFNNVVYEIPKEFSRYQRLAKNAKGVAIARKNPMNDSRP